LVVTPGLHSLDIDECRMAYISFLRCARLLAQF